MEDLLLELKPKFLNENELFNIKRKKNLYKNIWKTIGIILFICFIIVGIGIGSNTMIESITEYIFLITVIFSLIIFFPTMINLNYFLNGSSINRNDCYIRIYNDRLECYQIVSSLARERENAVLYYDEMKDWDIKHRATITGSSTRAKSRQVDCIQINMDIGSIKSKYSNMKLSKFYIEMSGYDREEFMNVMKVAFNKANEYRRITYHTYNKNYYLD